VAVGWRPDLCAFSSVWMIGWAPVSDRHHSLRPVRVRRLEGLGCSRVLEVICGGQETDRSDRARM